MALHPEQFLSVLQQNGVNFFCGVPDSLLKDFLLVVDEKLDASQHVICANEGCAIGLASGVYMGSATLPLVYMQNSGLGNTVNPLTSLAHRGVYGIPMILLIGWRGEPGVADEPQHTPMGESTCDLLSAIGIPFVTLDAETDCVDVMIENVCQQAKDSSQPYAIVCKKGTFQSVRGANTDSRYQLTREQAIQKILEASSPDDIFVGSTGQIGRELLELRKGQLPSDFMNVGAMGHTSQIALGLALTNPQRRVICLDGDGSLLMHMGGLATIGGAKPGNLFHIVLNNGAHQSVGGQPTAGFQIDLPSIAKACGYIQTLRCDNAQQLDSALGSFLSKAGPSLLEVRVAMSARDNLARPSKDMQGTRQAFMQNIKKSESVVAQ